MPSYNHPSSKMKPSLQSSQISAPYFFILFFLIMKPSVEMPSFGQRVPVREESAYDDLQLELY